MNPILMCALALAIVVGLVLLLAICIEMANRHNYGGALCAAVLILVLAWVGFDTFSASLVVQAAP